MKAQKTEMITIRATKEIKELLKEASEITGKSQSEIIAKAITDWYRSEGEIYVQRRELR